MTAPLVLISAVGLTRRLLPHAPRLNSLAQANWAVGQIEPSPAVTCTAQATLLTGKLPQNHGIVANGWLFRDTREIRLWQQSHHLIQSPTLPQILKAQNLPSKLPTFSGGSTRVHPSISASHPNPFTVPMATSALASTASPALCLTASKKIWGLFPSLPSGALVLACPPQNGSPKPLPMFCATTNRTYCLPTSPTSTISPSELA